MTTPPVSLSELLGLQTPPHGVLAWHRTLVDGFPSSTIQSLAAFLGAEESALRLWATGDRKKPGAVLNVGPSERLFRLARAVRYLQPCYPTDRAGLRAWLMSPQPTLKGLSPVDLLQTAYGGELVQAEIQRMLEQRALAKTGRSVGEPQERYDEES